MVYPRRGPTFHHSEDATIPSSGSCHMGYGGELGTNTVRRHGFRQRRNDMDAADGQSPSRGGRSRPGHVNLAILKVTCKGDDQSAYDALFADAPSYKELIQRVTRTFIKRRSPLDTSAELSQTVMREDESLSNFLHRIEALAADAGYNNHDFITATLERTPPHLKEAYKRLKALHKATPSLGDITYNAAVTALRVADETFKELYGHNTENPTQRHDEESALLQQLKYSQRTLTHTLSRPDIVCSTCSRPGHSQRDCTAPHKGKDQRGRAEGRASGGHASERDRLGMGNVFAVEGGSSMAPMARLRFEFELTKTSSHNSKTYARQQNGKTAARRQQKCNLA